MCFSSSGPRHDVIRLGSRRWREEAAVFLLVTWGSDDTTQEETGAFKGLGGIKCECADWVLAWAELLWRHTAGVLQIYSFCIRSGRNKKSELCFVYCCGENLSSDPHQCSLDIWWTSLGFSGWVIVLASCQYILNAQISYCLTLTLDPSARFDKPLNERRNPKSSNDSLSMIR